MPAQVTTLGQSWVVPRTPYHKWSGLHPADTASPLATLSNPKQGTEYQATEVTWGCFHRSK